MRVIAKSALLDQLRERGTSLSRQSPSPALTSAQAGLQSDLADLSEVPGEDTQEMIRYLRRQTGRHRTNRGLYLGAAATSLTLGMVGPFLKGPFWLPTLGVMVAIPLGLAGIKAQDQLETTQRQEGALRKWTEATEPRGKFSGEFVPVSSQPRLSELQGVLDSTRTALQQLGDEPTVVTAREKVHHDAETLSSVGEQQLDHLRQKLEQNNRELTSSIQGRTRLALGVGLASLAAFPLAGLFYEPLLPVAGLGLVTSMGLLLSTSPAQTRRSSNQEVLGVMRRWQPVLEAHQRVEQSGAGVEKLGRGSELAELNIEEDGLQVGDVFLPFS